MSFLVGPSIECEAADFPLLLTAVNLSRRKKKWCDWRYSTTFISQFSRLFSTSFYFVHLPLSLTLYIYPSSHSQCATFLTLSSSLHFHTLLQGLHSALVTTSLHFMSLAREERSHIYCTSLCRGVNLGSSAPLTICFPDTVALALSRLKESGRLPAQLMAHWVISSKILWKSIVVSAALWHEWKFKSCVYDKQP